MALTGIDRIIGAPLDEDNLVAAALNLIAGGASNDDLETKLGINANSISKLLERKTGFNTYSQQTYYEHIIASEAKSKEELWNYLARTIKKMHDSGLKKEKIAENLGITGSQVNVIFSDVYGVGISFYKSRKSVINPLLHEKGRVSEDEVNTLVTNSALSLILNEGARAYTVEQKITLPKHIIDATLIETTGYAYQEIFLLRNLILAQEGKDADMVDSFWRIHKSGDYPDYTSIRYAFMSYVQERLVDGDSLADIGESVDIDRHILQQMIKTSFGTTARGSKSAKLAVSKNAEKPVDIDKALSSLYAGKTPERIAASYGVSKKVLGQFIKEKTGILMLDHQTYKLHIKKSRARNISAVKEYVAFQIKELVDEGLFENDISRRLHMTQQKIQDDFRDRFGAGLMFYRSRHPYAIAAFNEEGKIDAQAVDKRISDDVIPYLWTVSGGNFVKGNIEFKRLEEVLGVSKTVMSLALQQEYGFGLEDMGHYGKLILSGVLKSGDIPEDYVLSRSLAAAQSGVSLRSLMEEMGVSDHIIRNELKKRMGITYQQACRYGKMAREMPKRQKKEKNVRAKKANDEIYSPQLSEIILGTVQEVKKNLLAGMDKHRISEFLQMEYGMLLRLFIRETGYNLQDWQRFHYVIEKFGQHSLIDTEAFLLAGIKDMIGTGVKERRNITEEDICSTFQISASTRAALMSKTGFSFLEWRAYYGVINSGIGENIKEVETYIALKAKAAAKNRITKADFSSNLCVNENAVMKLVKRETGYNYADWFTYGDNLERFDSVNEVKDYLKKEIVRLGFANVPQEKAAEMLGITVTVLRTLLQDHTHRTYQELRNVRFGVDAETFLADHRPSWMMSSKELSRFSYHEGIAYLVETAKNCAIRGVEQEDLAKRLEIDNHIISRRLFEETGFTYQQWFTYKENLTGHKSIGEAKQAIIAKAKNAAISGEFIRDLSNEIGVSVANIMALIETTGFSYGQWGDYKEYLAKAGSTESASELIWVDIVKKARGKVKYVDLHKALGLTQTLTDRILAEHTTRTYNDLKLYSRLVPMDELLDESVPLWTLIREAIEKRTEEGKSTAEIASEAGLSVCHIRNFKRAFRENKGDLFDALTILFPEFTTNDYKEISSILDARIAYISEMAEGTTYSDRVSRVKYGLDGATKIFKVYSHEDEARLEIDVARRTRTNQRNPYVPMPESEPIPYKGKYLVLWEDYGPSKLMDSRLAAAENTRYLRFEQFFDIKQFTQRQKNMHMESGLLKTIYALALFHSTNKDTSWLPESASKVPTFREYNEMIAVAERALVHEKDLRALLPRRAEYDSALKYFAEAISKTPDVGIHGDIKPDNTLQLKNGTVALCDFGCFRSASPLIDLAMLFASFDAMKYGRDQMRMFVDAYEFFRQEEDCALGYATNIFGPIDKYEASWQGTKVMALRMATKPALLAYMKERPFEGRSDLIITSNLSQAQYVH